MNREEALLEFREKVAYPLCKKTREEFMESLEIYYDGFKDEIIRKIKKIIEVANKRDNYNLVVFQIELLRTAILDESYRFYIHGYNEMWYLDEDDIVEEIDLKYLFKPYINLKEALLKEKKIYLGKVNNYDVESILYEAVTEVWLNLIEIARVLFWDLDEEPWIKENIKSQFYFVKWGEYQGKNETVFAMDYRKKTNKDMEAILKIDKSKNPFVYSSWINSTFDNLDLSENKMVFINLKGSVFEKINFQDSYIVKGQCDNAVFRDCNFTNCKMVSTSFKNVTIENCIFDNGLLRNTTFKDAQLSNVSFKNANLCDANLSGIKHKNLDFTEAEVEGALFDVMEIPFLHLSAEQLQTIYIEEE